MRCFLKRLICHHEYVYYNMIPDYRASDNMPFTIYKFICKKCRKVVKISKNDIEEKMLILEDEYKKDKVLNKSMNIKSSTIELYKYKSPSFQRYEGAYITLLIQYYKSKGIDITQIKEE